MLKIPQATAVAPISGQLLANQMKFSQEVRKRAREDVAGPPREEPLCVASDVQEENLLAYAALRTAKKQAERSEHTTPSRKRRWRTRN